MWAVRCMHEASLYENNCFLTLTYDEAHLPENGSLDKRDFQLFMKRLRREVIPNEVAKIRYYHCGEYGAAFGRPHYHAALFGFDFPDKVVWTIRKDYPTWRSPRLERLWPHGQSELGSVTFESAAYVARYIMKKVVGPMAFEHYTVVDLETGEGFIREPEYTTMSRRPGIGKGWFEKFGKEVYPADTVIARGLEMKPPRYYDLQHELVDQAGALEVARKRRRDRRLDDSTPERLAVREVCTKARMTRTERNLDNG